MNQLAACGSALQTGFCSNSTARGLLDLQIHALEKYVLGIVVIEFNHIGCGVGGV